MSTNIKLDITKRDELYDLTRHEVVYETFDKNSSNDTKDIIDEKTSELPSHPNTLKLYTSAMLSLFSNVETEYDDDKKHFKKLPVIFASREKLMDIEMHELESLSNGNTNMIPRASLSVEGISYDNQRALNRSINFPLNDTQALLNYKSEVMPAPTPYNVSYRLTILTRGFSDAFMITEQIASLFNPSYTIELYDALGLSKPSKIIIRLENCMFTPSDVDEYSQNEVLTEFEFTLYGYLYRTSFIEPIVNNINLN